MIVVDTNVWSETLRPEPASLVLSWLAAHALDIYIPVTAVYELRYGIQLLPTGRRRSALAAAVEQMLAGLRTRVLAYDFDAAQVHAELRATTRKAGRVLSAEDGQIAAIAQVAEASIATRNISDFTGLGVKLINPWNTTAYHRDQ